jgi:iron(III) transport system ATP-binding protein
MSVLTIRGLGKSFGTTTALADLDLDVAQGSRTAVVGPSGSGKTTLLRLIAGFEAPDSGEIRLADQVIANAEAGVPAHARSIGLVMQEGALFPHLSVIENIRFGIRRQGDGHARALKLMDLVELDRSMADRQPHQLSGGQQQRVALARALARQPRLMLLDEPFSALDTGLREQLREATAKILAEAGVATLLVTHDREEAMSFADQLVVLRQGRLVRAGNPRALYLSPGDAVTAQFLGSAIILDAAIHDGVADCALGLVPTDGADNGPASILVRPEQVRIEPAGAAAMPAWTILSVTQVGPSARLRLQRDQGKQLEFETATTLPLQPGQKVNLTVVGTAHRLGPSA